MAAQPNADSLLEGLKCDTPNNTAKAREVLSAFVLDETQTELNLSKLGIIDLPPAFFADPEIAKRIAELNCRNNLLTSIPNLSTCDALWRFDCSDNRLTVIPANILIASRLTLVDLICSKNQLKELPTELGACSELEFLDCSNNQLKTLPPELGDCVALNVFDCGFNQLATLPPELGKLTKLADLGCEDNPLNELPRDIFVAIDRPDDTADHIRTWWEKIKTQRVKPAR